MQDIPQSKYINETTNHERELKVNLLNHDMSTFCTIGLLKLPEKEPLLNLN